MDRGRGRTHGKEDPVQLHWSERERAWERPRGHRQEVAAVAAAAGATAYAWEKQAGGKKITLIGPKKAGKTTWRTFLETGTVPAGYKHTNATEIIDKDFRLGDLKMKIRVSDMSGSSAALGDWREYSESADHVDITELTGLALLNVAPTYVTPPQTMRY